MNAYRVFGYLILVEIVFGATSLAEAKANVRGIRAAKTIPIQPMDSASQRSFKTPPLNPDSELIFPPSHSHRYQYEKIMERLTAAPAATTNQSINTWPKKKNFEFLNFDAYLVRPMHVNYRKVFATVKPEAKKLLSAMNDEFDSAEVNRKNVTDSTKGYFLSPIK